MSGQSGSRGRLLLTGARGFVGRRVLEHAAARFDVHAVSSAHAVTSGMATWHQADLLDQRAVESLVHAVRPSHVLHLAWYTEHGLYWNAPQNLAWTAATLTLIEAFSRAGGSRFVGVGTCAEYAADAGTAIEGITPERPWTLYGECKLALARILADFSARQHFGSAWARLFYLFGPGESPQRFVPSLVRSLARNEDAVCRHPALVRDYLYVDDAAAALVALVASETTGTVNIGSGAPVALGDLARLVADRAGQPGRVRVDPPVAPAAEPLVVAADVTRLTRDVGWRPTWSLATAVDETIAWWAANSVR